MLRVNAELPADLQWLCSHMYGECYPALKLSGCLDPRVWNGRIMGTIRINTDI
jgi:hypothetical protein